MTIVTCDAQLINESSVFGLCVTGKKMNMFLFGEVSFSSGCLGSATLFYCGTP